MGARGRKKFYAIDDSMDEVFVEAWQRGNSIDACLLILRVPITEANRASAKARADRLRLEGVGNLKEYGIREIDRMHIERLSRIAKAAIDDPDPCFKEQAYTDDNPARSEYETVTVEPIVDEE